MKKYVLGLFACLAMMAFDSCGSDGEGPIPHDTTPEIATAGTYQGQFHVKWEDKQGKHEGYNPGTFTFSATEKTGISSLTIECPDMNLTIEIPQVNVWYAGKGFQFSVTGNALVNGTSQLLKIYGLSNDGSLLSSAFVVNVKVGRSTTSYMYDINEAVKVEEEIVK